MRLLRAVIGILAGIVSVAALRAGDPTWRYAVQLRANVTTDPARVELSWATDSYPVRDYSVHRKSLTDTTWSEGVTVAGDVTSIVDENVEAGKIYEYQVVRHGVGYTGYGYIAVGLDAPLVDSRGRVVLVVDRTIAERLTNELRRLEADLVGDGWLVTRKDVARDASPAEVRDAIKAEWEADREHTKAVLLFGHVPVLRSGNQNVDGHQARPHPADVFYGEMNGTWTDANGDGIYDQSALPSDLELMVGRVDFAELTGQFSSVRYPSEVELLKRYLDKDHAFRHAEIRPKARAIIGNQIGDGSGQAYAAMGYRNFAALVGAENILTANAELDAPVEERWISRLAAEDYLWAYACGAGGDFSISAMGMHGMYNDAWSSDFLELKPKGTFYLMFGSWFVDWAKPDNLLRSALAAPDHGLAAIYGGRPHIFFHTMGIGEPLGTGVRASQNNNGLYQNEVQRGVRGVHLALMGDPTLRMHQLAPARDVAVRLQGSDVVVTWSESRDKVLGYHVYRAASVNGPYTRLTNALVGENQFVDGQRIGGAATYMVRAVTRQTSPSGSYYNASQGVTATIDLPPIETSRASDDAANAPKPGDIVWFDDVLPVGASGFATENDRWEWTTGEPAPYSGTAAHRSPVAPGAHSHFLAYASSPLTVNAGDTLFVYAYLDPANPPRQIVVTWLTDNWEHRAYWGENLIAEGVDGTASRRYIGALPTLGRWVRLEVSASAVGLENQSITGMGFNLFDGGATWDRAGKSRP